MGCPLPFDRTHASSNQRKRFRRASEFVVVLGTLNRFEHRNGTIVSQVSSMAYMHTFSPDSMRDDVGILFLRTGLPMSPGGGVHLTVAPIQLAGQITPPASCARWPAGVEPSR